MVDLTDLMNNDRVIKKNKLKGITEMVLNLNELDNADILEDGRPNNLVYLSIFSGLAALMSADIARNL